MFIIKRSPTWHVKSVDSLNTISLNEVYISIQYSNVPGRHQELKKENKMLKKCVRSFRTCIEDTFPWSVFISLIGLFSYSNTFWCWPVLRKVFITIHHFFRKGYELLNIISSSPMIPGIRHIYFYYMKYFLLCMTIIYGLPNYGNLVWTKKNGKLFSFLLI